MANFDPVTTAQQLATAYVQSARSELAARTTAAKNTSTGLTALKSALSAFDTALSGLSSSSTGLRQFTATLSNSQIGTATASSSAAPGTYSFHVEQLATAHQVVFEDLPAVPVAFGGPLTIQLGDGSSINVNLVAADSDSDGTITQAEIARAINLAQDNQGKVTASVVSANGKTQLLLSAANTGASSAITLDTSALPASALKTSLDSGRQLVAAQDAIVWLGGQGGVKIQQASNTLTSIAGVTATFTQKMAPTDPAVTLTVAANPSGTAGNVQKFVDAYNTLAKSLDSLTKVSADGTGAAGAFATDAGIRAMRSRLNSMIRQDFGGLTLADLGIKGGRDGMLTLDSARLEKTLAARPDALETVFGKASVTQSSGLLGALDQYVDVWLKSGTGQIASRQTSVQSVQKRLTERQARLDAQYDHAYERYLKQFSELQSLQAQMDQTSGLFSSIPGT